MYVKDKIILFIIFIISGIASWKLGFQYGNFAADSLNVVAIAIAIYLAVIPLIIKGKLVEELKHADYFIPEKTKAGVLITYLKYATLHGIFSVFFSSIVSMIGMNFYSDPTANLVLDCGGIYFFNSTIFFMWRIFKFISLIPLKEVR